MTVGGKGIQTKSTKPIYNVIPEIFEAQKNYQESLLFQKETSNLFYLQNNKIPACAGMT